MRKYKPGDNFTIVVNPPNAPPEKAPKTCVKRRIRRFIYELREPVFTVLKIAAVKIIVDLLMAAIRLIIEL